MVVFRVGCFAVGVFALDCKCTITITLTPKKIITTIKVDMELGRVGFAYLTAKRLHKNMQSCDESITYIIQTPLKGGYLKRINALLECLRNKSFL